MSLPENIGYSQHLKKMSDVARGVGRTLGPRKRPPKAVDTSRFSGIASAVKSGVPEQKQYITPSMEKLGALTVDYGGSTRYEKFHPGLDLAANIGTPIPAWTGGRVSEVVSGKRQGDPAFGNYVIVTDKDGNKHRYSHLQNNYVNIGDEIKRGRVIGGMGNTGQTYSVSGGDASHLDYRIRDLYGKYVSPYQFVN